MWNLSATREKYGEQDQINIWIDNSTEFSKTGE